MNEVAAEKKKTDDPEILLKELTKVQAEIVGVGKKTLAGVLKAGELLVKLKTLRKGSYTALVKEKASETGISWKTANNYTRVYLAKKEKLVRFKPDWTITDAYMAVGIMRSGEDKKKKAQKPEDRADKQTGSVLQLVKPENVKAVKKDRTEVLNLLKYLSENLDEAMSLIEGRLLIEFELAA